jgi:hypothetical protein
VGECHERHRHQEFLKFLRRLNTEFPGDVPLHLNRDRAAERIPQALLIEARMLQARSRTAEAAGKLRSYLAPRDFPADAGRKMVGDNDGGQRQAALTAFTWAPA